MSSPGAGGRPVVFLDRDGTIILDRDHLADPAGVELIDGAAEALGRLRAAGFALVVVTNQSGIARGLFTETDYRAVAARTAELLAREGIRLDAVYHCPHHPRFGGPCECRKPAAGHHRRAAGELGLALQGCWCVGDRVSDLLPARVLGGRGLLVRTGFGRSQEAALPDDFEAVDDLAAAAARIAGGGGQPAEGAERARAG